jgi:hypothetical protein
MLPIHRYPSWASPTALTYVTLGALLTVWCLISGLYAYYHPFANRSVYYFGAGLLGTGLVLLAIGLSLGWITRLARKAELPPVDSGRRRAGR